MKSIPGLLFNVYKFGLRKKIFEKLSQCRYTEYERIQGHSGTGLIYEMVLVKKLKLEASGPDCRKQYS